MRSFGYGSGLKTVCERTLVRKDGRVTPGRIHGGGRDERIVRAQERDDRFEVVVREERELRHVGRQVLSVAVDARSEQVDQLAVGPGSDPVRGVLVMFFEKMGPNCLGASRSCLPVSFRGRGVLVAVDAARGSRSFVRARPSPA